MSLDEAKASSRIVREKGKAVTNRSTLSEVRDSLAERLRQRDIFVNAKPSRKERHKAEQATLKPVKEASQAAAEIEVEIAETQDTWEMPALIDYIDRKQWSFTYLITITTYARDPMYPTVKLFAIVRSRRDRILPVKYILRGND